MERTRCALWAGLLALAAVFGGPAAARAATLAVVAKHEDRVELVDPESGRVRARIPVGRGPHELAASPDGRRLFVANYGNTVRDTGRTLHVIDVARRTVLREVSVAPFVNPHGLAVGEGGRLLWVAVQGPGTNAVLELDAESGERLRFWNTGQSQTHMVVAGPEERRLYATNIASGSVTRIDRATGGTRVIPTGAGAAAAAVSPDGRWLWVPNEDEDTVTVIDLETEQPVARLPAGGRRPVRARFARGGREVWVTNFASDSVSVFDAATRAPLDTVMLHRPPREGAIGLLVSPDGGRAFVAHMHADRVWVLDVPTRRVLRTLAVGQGADGMAWLP